MQEVSDFANNGEDKDECEKEEKCRNVEENICKQVEEEVCENTVKTVCQSRLEQNCGEENMEIELVPNLEIEVEAENTETQIQSDIADKSETESNEYFDPNFDNEVEQELKGNVSAKDEKETNINKVFQMNLTTTIESDEENIETTTSEAEEVNEDVTDYDYSDYGIGQIDIRIGRTEANDKNNPITGVLEEAAIKEIVDNVIDIVTEATPKNEAKEDRKVRELKDIINFYKRENQATNEMLSDSLFTTPTIKTTTKFEETSKDTNGTKFHAFMRLIEGNEGPE